MIDLRQETVDTYNKTAQAMANKFTAIGPRTADIDLGFELCKNRKHARVLEIGCGNGRDALEIVRRATWYRGMDISENLLQIARQVCPSAQFIQGDVTKYNFPPRLDIIFAFASLLHIDKQEMKRVLKRAYTSLNPGGVFYISLKYLPEYTEKIKTDQFGRRQFFFYNPELIIELAGEVYEPIYIDMQHFQDVEWFTIVLKKPS